ncbi:hypothetical protein ACKYVA_21870, partial [Paenibacillus larvae]|uniref:hypothetical protein n=1 Tax=Paenibacillus larvae TaxID=1464 RepID=UPI003908295B
VSLHNEALESPCITIISLSVVRSTFCWANTQVTEGGILLIARSTALTEKFIELAVVDPAEQQAHRDVPAGGSVYSSMAGLLAFQVVPVDAGV